MKEYRKFSENNLKWLLNLLNAFKENVNIPTSYIERLLHYYTEMTGLVSRRIDT